MLICPKNTIPNSLKNTCEIISYLNDDSITLIWVLAIIVVFIMIVGIGMAPFLILKHKPTRNSTKLKLDYWKIFIYEYIIIVI